MTDTENIHTQLVVVLLPEDVKLTASHRYLACEPDPTSPHELDASREVYRVLEAFKTAALARNHPRGKSGAVVVERTYGSYATPALIAQRAEHRDDCDFEVQTGCDVDELEEVLEDITCRRCGESNEGGEGWDGLCGNCADVVEAADAWEDWR